MLLILIATVWLALAAFFVLLGRMAARSERELAPSTIKESDVAKVVLSPEGRLVIAPPARRRVTAGARRATPARRTRSLQHAPHGGRVHS